MKKLRKSKNAKIKASLDASIDELLSLETDLEHAQMTVNQHAIEFRRIIKDIRLKTNSIA